MSKFCANCGKEIAETDNVCSNCGTPVGGKAPVNNAGNAPLEGQYKTYAIVSLVCGISSIALCWWHWVLAIICIILGVVAIIFSVKAKKGGKSGMATAGLVCGIIGLALAVLEAACLGCIACAACGIKNAVEGASTNLNNIDWSKYLN